MDNKKEYRIFTAAMFLCAILLVIISLSGCADKSSPRLREVERITEMSDEEIIASREACHLISTTDYNCAELLAPTLGMSSEEWKSLTDSTKECRRNQMLSFQHCLRGKGVRYSEFH